MAQTSAARRIGRKSAAAAPEGGRGVVNSADPSQGRLGGELGHGGDGCHHTWSGGLHLRYTAPTTFRASRQSVAATPDERLGGSARFFRSLDAHRVAAVRHGDGDRWWSTPSAAPTRVTPDGPVGKMTTVWKLDPKD